MNTTIQYDDIDNPDLIPHLPGWFLALLMALLLSVLSLTFANGADVPDPGLVPGGIQVQADGEAVRFVIDLADVNWSDPRIKTLPWVFRPLGAARVIGANTAENVKTHPGKWTLVGLAGYALASGKAGEWLDKGADLLGVDDDRDKGRSPVKTPSSAADRPAVVITGNGNVVETTETGGIWVEGQGNSVTVNPYPNSL